MHDTQNAGFCFKFFKIKPAQTGPMGPSTFPLGHDKFDEGSPIVYLLIKFCFTH